ncbi:High mobility group box domain superfamily [Arabidopsis thaliana x Arabidopsis arenosa]|uniref:High mobility group box domain superfamily n=1 Tax=Arabidopsis thaliana x Arabidopsis arenosa TaxID=1240361 RepID=A0A8T1YZQ7_9BRAS|nr:High mobility group box domain superfamily [Arabidopsis thaliana x Arabidopsis arenosa]
MAGPSTTSNAPKQRKRVEAETSTNASTTLRRAKDGSAFALCEGCNKSVAVALISMHNCSLDAKIRVNLEAQVVETQAEAKKKPAEKKKTTGDGPKPKRLKKTNDEKKSSSTSNKPKRPLTAFFIFMNDFRKTYTDKNPYINVRDLAKHGVEKWKSLTEKKKKFYLVKAAQLKAEYNKSLENNEEVEDEEKQADNAEEIEVENTDNEGKEEEE